MKIYLLNILRKNKHVLILFYIFLSIFNSIKIKIVNKSLKTGNRAENSKNLTNYYNFCINTFLRSQEDFTQFRSALEIGPGDSLLLAAIMKKFGIKSIDVIEKFQKPKPLNIQDLEVQNIIQSITRKKILPDELPYIRVLENNLHALKEDLTSINKHYCLIYSVSVCEHLWPLEENIRAMHSILKNGGFMMHIVNFTDHGMYSPEHNRFFFRKVKFRLYKYCMKISGRPNGVLPSELKAMMEKMGMDVKIIPLKTHTNVVIDSEKLKIADISKEELIEIMEVYKLNPHKDSNEIQDVAIGSALVVAQKI